MTFENRSHVSSFLFACFSVFFFVYALPFIYIGYCPYRDDPIVCNPTVLDAVDLGQPEEFPPVTPLALGFARQLKTRLIVTIASILILFILHMINIPPKLKITLCHVMIWLGACVFLLNYLGLVFLLVCF